MKEEKSLDASIEELKNQFNHVKEELEKGPAFEVTAESSLSDKYLSDAAKLALSKTEKTLVAQYNEKIKDNEDGSSDYIRKAAVCEFYTCQVRKDRIEDGVKAISASINALAEMGAIQSCLTTVSSLKLAEAMFSYPNVAVFCFVHIKPEFSERARNMKHHTIEGGVGEPLHDLSPDLAPGEFLADGRIIAFLGPDKKSNESLIFDRVNEYLKYLPEGTKFLGYRTCAVMDLSLPVELKFRNPLLPNVTRVDLDYVRQVAIVDDKLKQFNLFLGVRYFGIDPITKEKNKELFRY